MDSTRKAPNVPLSQFKRTKIIATVGPATNSYEAILALIKAGANGIRLNFSHGSQEERTAQIKWIRRAANEYGKPVAIIQDLQGPKMRLGDFEGIINVSTGQSLTLGYNTSWDAGQVIPTQYDLSKKVKRGEKIYLYDGKIRAVVTSVNDGLVHLRAENNGILIKRKSINLPDTDFGGDIITKKDHEDIAYGTTTDIDYVAMSFIQSAADVRKLRTILRNLGSDARIIAKIETRAAIENLDGIIQESDAVMVARGDLGVEAPPESVPIIQRNILRLGLRYAKPTIVATQMLASMTETPEPTRAEVSDVATAVLLGADCVMLSDETASGQYPLEAVQMMKRVVLYTQNNAPLRVSYDVEGGVVPTRQSAISQAIVSLAEELKVQAIVAETKSGATAQQIAIHRPDIPLIVVTSDKRVAQQLAILYGSKTYVRPDDKFAATKLTNWLRKNRVLNKGDVVVTASGQYPGVVGTTDTIKVRILE